MTQAKPYRRIFPFEGLRIFLCLAAFVPLLSKLPYMIRAWKQSPLDRPDIFFMLLFLVLLAGSLPGLIKSRQPAVDWRSLAILLPAVLLFGLAHVFRINAIGILAGVVFAWAVFWFSLGWPPALLAAPSFWILLLTCTSSRYWLTYFFTPLRMDGLVIKLAIAFLCSIALLILITRKIRFSPGSFCFLHLLFLALLFLLHGQTPHTQSPPFLPSFDRLVSGDFIGKPGEITDFDRRFFKNAPIEKYYYASSQQAISVLKVTCNGNLQQIHPASHCLRSSGWQILQEKPAELVIHNKKTTVSEIIAQRGPSRMMVLVWYSSPYRSVSNFLHFRSLYPTWKEGEVWHEYQIATPCGNDVTQSRTTLADFLNQLE